jgi:hypothetical protein
MPSTGGIPRIARQRELIAVQLDAISSSRVPDPIDVDPRPFCDSSTIHSISPGRKLCDWTLFESIDEYVPLPNFGLSP